MKTYSLAGKAALILGVFLASCGSENTHSSEEPAADLPAVETVAKEETSRPAEEPTDDLPQRHLLLAEMDSSVFTYMAGWEERYQSVPAFIQLDGSVYYILSTSKKGLDYGFNSKALYGLARDSSELMLSPVYQTVYNPNLTLQGCFEIKKNDKVGLLDYRTGEVLKPQFAYILPGAGEEKQVAYGYADQTWYEIKAGHIMEANPVDFDPVPLLKSLGLSIESIGSNIMLNSEVRNAHQNMDMGYGVLVAPSFYEYHKLLPNNSYVNLIHSEEYYADFGTVMAKVEPEASESLTDKITSFILSAYEEGLDGRGYMLEESKMMVYHESEKRLEAISFGFSDEYDFACAESGYAFVNDSTFEVENGSANLEEGGRYDFGTKFIYYRIEDNGTIRRLESVRRFDFTKYTYLTDKHLKGCYIYFFEEGVENEDGSYYNSWHSDHLDMEDMDIMRNEIFAEYGYRFTSEKWQTYFGEKDWYTPVTDDVDSLLTDIDRANLETIRRIQEEMKKDEQTYTNRRKAGHFAAG